MHIFHPYAKEKTSPAHIPSPSCNPPCFPSLLRSLLAMSPAIEAAASHRARTRLFLFVHPHFKRGNPESGDTDARGRNRVCETLIFPFPLPAGRVRMHGILQDGWRVRRRGGREGGGGKKSPSPSPSHPCPPTYLLPTYDCSITSFPAGFGLGWTGKAVLEGKKREGKGSEGVPTGVRMDLDGVNGGVPGVCLWRGLYRRTS